MRWIQAAAGLVFLLGMAGVAAASPAQEGLTGWSEMRTPELTTAPTVYVGERYAQLVPWLGHRNTLSVGYVDILGTTVEWGVMLPLVTSDAGTGLNQPRAMGKWRMLDTASVDVAASADLLLPAGVGYSDTGTGQFGLGGGVQILVEQSGVQLAWSGSTERADTCLGCTRAAPLPANRRFTSAAFDSALGLRVPIETFAVVAEFHEKWNRAHHFGRYLHDGDLYGHVGGEIPVGADVDVKVYVGSGVTSHKNTDLFGGLTVGYAFGATAAPSTDTTQD